MGTRLALACPEIAVAPLTKCGGSSTRLWLARNDTFASSTFSTSPTLKKNETALKAASFGFALTCLLTARRGVVCR